MEKFGKEYFVQCTRLEDTQREGNCQGVVDEAYSTRSSWRGEIYWTYFIRSTRAGEGLGEASVKSYQVTCL